MPSATFRWVHDNDTQESKIGENDWAGHKEVFLSFYNVKGTAKLNFFSLHKMKQNPTEKV